MILVNPRSTQEATMSTVTTLEPTLVWRHAPQASFRHGPQAAFRHGPEAAYRHGPQAGWHHGPGARGRDRCLVA